MSFTEKILIRKLGLKNVLENEWEKSGVVDDKILNLKTGEKY